MQISQATTEKFGVKAQSATNHRPLELGSEPAHNGAEERKGECKIHEYSRTWSIDPHLKR